MTLSLLRRACAPQKSAAAPRAVAAATARLVQHAACCRPAVRVVAAQRGRTRASSGGQAGAADAVEPEVVPAPAVALPEAGTDGEQQAVASHALPDLFGAQELLSELQDERAFGKRGEVWTLAQIAVIGLLLLPPFQLVGLVDILATLAITAGAVFMGYGLVSLGRYISPLPAPRVNHQLVTGGMFAYVRHPMYGGLLMAALGLAVVTRSETRLALAALLWVVLEKKTRIEESMLAELYGKAWTEYCGRVASKFFPYLY